ncbi:hypothetical protein B14911_16580 [Bacillus sp. NRRL B-14911]|nr:hypothetical protein B14911_16580 [Bacillus sp. NRRL B-14911]
MKKWKIASALLAASLMLAACGSDEEASGEKKLSLQVSKLPGQQLSKMVLIQ